MTRQSAPSAELERLQDIDFAPLDRALIALVRAQLEGGTTEQQAAQVRVAEVMGDVFVAGDLMGRRRVELEIGGGRIAARAPYDLPEAVFLETNRRLPKVSFRTAIEGLLARVPRVARTWHEIARLYREGPAFAAARAANETVARKIRDVVGGYLREGRPVASARALLAEMTGWATAYSENVYRTNLNTAYTSGRFDHAAHEDIAPEFPAMRFAAVLDASVRPNHAAAHDLVAPTQDPIWNDYAPPIGYQCLLPGARVSGDVEAAVRSFYDGPAVELETRAGARLRLTVNHPILTRRGWIGAGAVREGDEVLRHGGYIAALRAPDHDDVPPRIEDVFDALAAQGVGPVPARCLPLDLHGDARATQGDVHVVRADGLLPRQVAFAAPTEFGGEGVFVPPGATSASGPDGGGDPDAALHRHGGTAHRSPRRAGLAFDDPPVVAALLAEPPLHSLRVGQAAALDVLLPQDARHDAARDAEFVRERLLARPGQVAPDEVVAVRQFVWRGHVFDLQTTTGVMFAQGLAISNCRCSTILLDRNEAARRGALVDGLPRVVLPRSFRLARPDPGFGGRRPGLLWRRPGT